MALLILKINSLSHGLPLFIFPLNPLLIANEIRNQSNNTN